MRSCTLSWSEGHNWTAYIPAKLLDDTFEYKYVIQNTENKAVTRWEGGLNRKISIMGIRKLFDLPDMAERINELEEFEFSMKGVNMRYFPARMKIVVKDYWHDSQCTASVSYTHLTLPTNREV
eukprot:TRINITY_DN1524_c0_g3_i2.p1 TRINITY_DN1524_c0_g3~~TRINITY_DN1524_c0_g3_i2.p1  ORF type:complete len:123 (-),score=33.08 TRINITY_DN1524_c0_g3_i2:47-415(-)